MNGWPMSAGLMFLFSLFLGEIAFGEPICPEGPENPKPAKSLSFSTTYTGEVLGNLSGGFKQGAIYEGVLTVGCEGDLEKLLQWKGASFVVNVIYPHGSSLTNNYVGDLNRVSNIDAFDTVRLSEVWLQQEFAQGKFSIRVGQLLADCEFFVSDNAAVFLNGAFGTPSIVALNLRVPAYPMAAPGVRLRWNMNQAVSAQIGFFAGDTGDEIANNKHGMTWRLGSDRGMMGIAEVSYQRNAGTQAAPLNGTYKIGAFFHTPTMTYAFPVENWRGDAGGVLIADQEFWRRGDQKVLGGFLRMGGAPAKRNFARFFFDGGLNFKGLIRKDDVAGIGFSYTNLSDCAGVPIETRYEAILEATYKAQIRPWLCVQPDLQYIFNPGAVQAAPNAVVAGVRVTLSY